MVGNELFLYFKDKVLNNPLTVLGLPMHLNSLISGFRMSKRVTEANVAELFVLACRHSAHSLKKSVSKFIQENMGRVESTEGMKKLDREHLIEILKLARRRK